MQDLTKTILEELYKKHHEKLFNFEECNQIAKEIQGEKQRILEEIDPNLENALSRRVKEGQGLCKLADSLLEDSRQVQEDITTNLEEVAEVTRKLQEYKEKINVLQCTVQYMKVVQQIEFFSVELQREASKKDIERSTTLFANLCEISRNLTDSPMTHLRNHLKKTLHFWHNILKEKLSKDLDEVLKALKWPFVSSNFSLVTPLPATGRKLQIVCEYLLQIEIPSESSLPVVTSALLSDFPPLSLPILLLILPLKKRFLYHFYGARQTNRAEKPEWYFTKVLTWIRDHRDFVETWVQPVVDKLGLYHIDAKLELIRGLVQLAVEKLHSDIPSLQFDDFTFSHTIDEALGFDKELRDTYNYPQNQPSVIGVLTQAPVFIKWLAMEKKYATEKMDAMLSSNELEAFEPLISDVEDLKITTCADAFITLLQTITDRYEPLPQPGHRLQFLDLQLDLLDDFRVRLLQLVNAEVGIVAVESKIPMIANTIYYIENVLLDWGSTLHFLNLLYYKHQSTYLTSEPPPVTSDEDIDEEITTQTVFEEILSLYRHMRKDLLCMLTESIINEVKPRSHNYRQEKWSQMTTKVKDFKSLSLTPSACPVFEIIAQRLHQLQKCLHDKLFGFVWRSLAQNLDQFLFEDLLMDSRFSEGGALQLKYDVTRNLLPLFSQYTEKPANHFTKMVEGCNLLTIPKGAALLLRKYMIDLEGAEGVEDTRPNALKEAGAGSFTPKIALAVLNQRFDFLQRTVFD